MLYSLEIAFFTKMLGGACASQRAQGSSAFQISLNYQQQAKPKRVNFKFLINELQISEKFMHIAFTKLR